MTTFRSQSFGALHVPSPMPVLFVRQEIGDHNESLPIVTMRDLFSGTVTVTQTNEFIFIFIFVFIYFLLGRFRPALLPLFLVAALTCTRFTLTTSKKRGVAVLHFFRRPNERFRLDP